MRSLIIFNFDNMVPGEDDVLIDYANEEMGNKDVKADQKTLESIKVVKNGRSVELEINQNT